jgi:hypothetical protein
MASFVSRELGSVAKTVADTFVSKRHRNKKRRLEGPPSTDAESKPTPTGPIWTQPIRSGSKMPTPVLPMMPTVGEQRKTSQPKEEPTRMEEIRAAKAGITRPEFSAKTAGSPEG